MDAIFPVGKAYLLLGLLAALMYAFAASSIKAASDKGALPLHTTLYANSVIALMSLAFMPWRAGEIWPASWFASSVLGALFLLGQWLTLLALKRGHASVATPALGSKVVLVALILGLLFRRDISLSIWIAAVLTSCALGVLAISPGGAKGGPILSTLCYSIGAASCFGMLDVLVQVWSTEFSFGRLVPWAMILAAIGAVPITKTLEPQPQNLLPGAKWYLRIGVFFMAAQSVILIWSIGIFGDAAGINVVYGSRGIWSVLLVWLFGHFFSEAERLRHPGLIAMRLLGATLIAIAITLVFR